MYERECSAANNHNDKDLVYNSTTGGREGGSM